MATDKNTKPVTSTVDKPAKPSNFDMFESLRRRWAAKEKHGTRSPAPEKTPLTETSADEEVAPLRSGAN
jgi:hypothetical protein